jgi:hypothetical protein
MDASIARALLHGFSGYSPVLPSIINSMTLQLYLAARDPARPGSGSERDTLEANFSLALYALHHHFENDTHGVAVAILKKAWRQHEPFALYLRSFSFGAQLGEPHAGESGFIIADTHDLMEDELFQTWLVEHVVPRIPVVAIENPTFELRHDNSLPRLSLTDESWQRVVTSIIPAVAMIFMYIGPITDGVRWEIDAVRAANRQRSTILCYTEPIVNIDVSDFPIAVAWQGERASAMALSTMQTAPADEKVQYLELDFPSEPLPPPPVHSHTDAIANMGLLAGRGMMENGSFVDAVDAFVASIAASFWSQNAHARAFAYRYLASAFRRQDKVQYAIENLERAVDLFERFARDQPSSVAEVMRDVREFDGMFGQFSGVDRAVRLHKRLAILQSMENNV